MNILIYNFIHIIAFPFILIFFIFRIILKKENFNSFSQKLLVFGKKENYDYIIHVASVGELNSISFLINEISENKKILITCSTLSAYKLAINKYSQYKILYLTYDFYPLVNLFLSKYKTRKFIWIDSEIWPNYLYGLKSRKIQTYLINARMSEKSFTRWSLVSSFIKEMGLIYKTVYASSSVDKKRFEMLFKREIFFSGNLKFYQKFNIQIKKNKNLCFASIHHQEYKKIIKIISEIKLDDIEKIFLIPRHPQYTSLLNHELLKNKIPLKKIMIIDEIGKNKNFHSISKVTFMGGSLFRHGGQNPLEALSCGSYVLTGPYNNNFSSMYEELETKNLCGVFKEIDHNLIAKSINEIMKKNNLLDMNRVNNLFLQKKEELKKITNTIKYD